MSLIPGVRKIYQALSVTLGWLHSISVSQLSCLKNKDDSEPLNPWDLTISQVYADLLFTQLKNANNLLFQKRNVFNQEL